MTNQHAIEMRIEHMLNACWANYSEFPFANAFNYPTNIAGMAGWPAFPAFD